MLACEGDGGRGDSAGPRRHRGAPVRHLIWIGLAALVFAGSTARALAEDAEIGMVKTVQGAAFVTSGGTKAPATLGLRLHKRDVIETGADGSVGVTFQDDTIISVGPDSSLALDQFDFAPAEEKYSFVTRMTRGTMYYASGVMAKLAPEAVSVVTPVGTIGIRGTRFLVKLDDKK